MKWPYDRRVDAAHAWGVVAVGTAGIVAIATVLATLNSTDGRFRWWWPTNWMIVPTAIFLIGFALTVVPVIGFRNSPQSDGCPTEATTTADGGPSGGHVFISYVREDSGKVDSLQRALEAAGVQVWRDTANIWPGENWRTKIREAITGDALVFIACFSSNSAARQKSYHHQELRLAVDQLQIRRPDDPWLIPVRFDDCDIRNFELGAGRTLASIQWADIFGVNSNLETGRLVAAVQRLLQRPDPTIASCHSAPTAESCELQHDSPPETAITASREHDSGEDASEVPISGRSVSGTSLRAELTSDRGTLPPIQRRTAIIVGSVVLSIIALGVTVVLALPGSKPLAGPRADPSATVKAIPSPAVPANVSGALPTIGITHAKYTGTTSTQSGKAVAYAFAQLGCTYGLGSIGSCDADFTAPGLVTSAWASAGVILPGAVSSEWATLPHVSSSSLQPGDLVFYKSIGLVAMYVGRGMIIDAFPADQPVRELSMHTAWYRENYDGVVGPPVSASKANKSSSRSAESSKEIGEAMLSLLGSNQTIQWACLDKLWMRVSGWNVYAVGPSGAYGIPQAKPGSKMASAGRDWLTNPATQISWGLDYISHFYGSPCSAWDHEIAHGYY